jgi:hypothetical protein
VLAVLRSRILVLLVNTKKMQFETSARAAPAYDPDSSDAESPTLSERSRQLALRLADMEPVEVAPLQRPKPNLRDIQAHIAYLSAQLETLRGQLRDHPTDRLALLLREMIEEREMSLDRWIAQEERWDQRVATIENAISERDAYRKREADLIRERDEARREAAAAETRLAQARHAAEDAQRAAAALARKADLATAEQLRLRHERDIDTNTWMTEKRQLATQVERLKVRGWLAKFVGG